MSEYGARERRQIRRLNLELASLHAREDIASRTAPSHDESGWPDCPGCGQSCTGKCGEQPSCTRCQIVVAAC